MKPKIISHRQNILRLGNSSINGLSCIRNPATTSFSDKSHQLPYRLMLNLKISPLCPSNAGSIFLHSCCRSRHPTVLKAIDQENNLPVEAEEDDQLCPVECVREFKTDDEFFRILEKSKKTNSLVVVDFYRTSCGSCKYIAQGFSKLCKGSGDEDAPVIFLKHNVMDEYEEQSEVAERLRIKTVPMFHFYKEGKLVEAFATRDKDRIDETIHRYTSPSFQDKGRAPVSNL